MKNTIKILITAVLILSMTAIPVTAVDDEIGIEQYMLELNGDVNGDGLIDNLDAALILEYDAGIIDEFKNNNVATVPLDEEHKKEIIADYLEYNDHLEEGDILELRSVCVLDGCEVLWIRALETTLDTTDYHDVGGYYIEQIFLTWLFVYKDGKFYGLQAALDKGYIDSDDVVEILKCSNLGIYPTQYFTRNDLIGGKIEYFVGSRLGDVNCDRVIDDLDAGIILKHDVGL